MSKASDMTDKSKTSAFPTVRQWQRDPRDDPDQETPKCPICGCSRGVREAMYNPSGATDATAVAAVVGVFLWLVAAL
jgi:hypothetical protein